MLIAAKVGFYMAMASNFLTGTFALGRINAVDEGIPTTYLIFLITGIFG